MGEAKRRAGEIARLKAEMADWKDALVGAEKEILTLAERLDERLVRGQKFSQGCYHLAFFMTLYLRERGIEVEPVIGWVNDGTWKGVTSHAWVEFMGRKTDASLGCTQDPALQPTGGLLVLDKIIRKGMADYRYFKNDDPAVQAGIEYMHSHPDPDLRAGIAFKEQQHRKMLDIAQNDEIAAYLSKAPAWGRYENLSNLVR